MTTLDIINQDGTLVVTSETIAEGSGVQHRNVLELIQSHRPDFDDFGLVRFETRPRPAGQHGGGETRVALLNEQQATLLMTYQRNSEQVRQFKKALVKAFFDMARQLATPQVPQTLPDALRAYAAEVEHRQALEAKAAADAPKVLFADSVATSDSTILVGELSKILRGNGVEIGGTRLFARLREDGYLIKREGSDWNMPTQKSMELGLFRIKESAVTHSDGHVTVNKTPKVTGKGQAYFVNRYTGDLAA
jgi:anti-repressor protein